MLAGTARPSPAPTDSTSKPGIIEGNRWRLQFGGFAVLQEWQAPQYFPTGNLDYRWSPSYDEASGFVSTRSQSSISSTTLPEDDTRIIRRMP